MKTTNNNRKSKILALLLSVMMFSSMGAAFASCADDSDSSSSSSSSSTSSSEATAPDKVDNGTIKNAHFDFTPLNETTKIGTSVSGWSRSANSVTTGSAPSSKSASGVIDTAETAWTDLTTRTKTEDEIKGMQISDAVNVWSSLTTADKLAFYEDWKGRKENKSLDIKKEFDKVKKDSYQSFNIDAEDLPTLNLANPGVAPNQADTDDKGNARDEDTQILMIHNNNSIGTAQKYSSSSTVTVAAGSAAKVSLWVKTADLKTVDSNKEEQDAVGKGAYIAITQTIGGKALDSYEVQNIVAEEWTQYTFYLKGSSFAPTKFSIVLGLGRSGGSDHLDYVNGYAFFDNIEYTELTRDEYDTQTDSVNKEAFLDSEKMDKTVDAYEEADTAFAMNFYDADANSTSAGWVDADNMFMNTAPKATEGTNGAKTNSELYEASKDKDVMGVFTNRAAIETEATNKNNTYLKTIYDHFLKDTDTDNDFLKDDQEIFMMLSTGGAAYTWKKAYRFTMPADVDYMAVSFYAKTSDFGEGTGLTITLTDDDNSSVFPSINTAKLEGVTINGIEDYYDGWQRYYFFVEKGQDLRGLSQSFYLDFNYGPTSFDVNTPKKSFEKGFAAMTKFETLNMTSLEYQCAQTDSYAQKYTLVVSEEDKALGNAGFDSVASTPSDSLKNGLGNPQNYKGVYSDSYYVNVPTGAVADNDERRLINQYANAGLLNKDLFVDAKNNIVEKNKDAAWMQGLKSVSGETVANKIWNEVFGNATQPLFIWNDGAKSYGYIGGSTTINNEYSLVSVRVKTGGGAKASVYLVDMDDETRQSYFKVSNQLTYWYDDNGNILTNDPEEKTSVIAFRLDKKTGLYKADKKWAKYDAYKDQYFANLAAYEGFATGAEVLYAAKDSAMHSYHNSAWDRAVYYKGTDGAYYTAKENGLKVNDLQTVADITRRYEGGESATLAISDIDTQGEWATVTFYVKKGVGVKNYRLEVWSSATRAGAANPANSYVIFDTSNPGNAADNYDPLMEEYKDTATTKFESVFSYYDTDKHVRYDESLDVDKVGNLYATSFNPTNYDSAIAYMRHETKNANDVTTEYTVFVNFSLSDQVIYPSAPDVDEETPDTTPTTPGEDDMNIFLLVSSIAVSAALFIAIGAVVTRRIIAFVKKRKSAKTRVNVVKKSK